jgi:hypothetical protein
LYAYDISEKDMKHLETFISMKFISFRCMHKTGGSLQFTPTKCLKIVEACFKLHNQALKDKLPTEVNTFVNIYHNDDIYVQQGNQTEGQAIRQRLIQRF